jgi:hypothetical protein
MVTPPEVPRNAKAAPDEREGAAKASIKTGVLRGSGRPVTHMIDDLLETRLHSRARAHHLAHDLPPLPQRSITV